MARTRVGRGYRWPALSELSNSCLKECPQKAGDATRWFNQACTRHQCRPSHSERYPLQPCKATGLGTSISAVTHLGALVLHALGAVGLAPEAGFAPKVGAVGGKAAGGMAHRVWVRQGSKGRTQGRCRGSRQQWPSERYLQVEKQMLCRRAALAASCSSLLTGRLHQRLAQLPCISLTLALHAPAFLSSVIAAALLPAGAVALGPRHAAA